MFQLKSYFKKYFQEKKKVFSKEEKSFPKKKSFQKNNLCKYFFQKWNSQKKIFCKEKEFKKRNVLQRKVFRGEEF